MIRPYSKKAGQGKINKNHTRASKYRGVSKNGSLWQVQLGNTSSKRYVGSSKTEKEAAIQYDKKAIIANGLKARTNFAYSKSDLEKIICCYEHEKNMGLA